jgi:hypothetical protein
LRNGAGEGMKRRIAATSAVYTVADLVDAER